MDRLVQQALETVTLLMVTALGCRSLWQQGVLRRLLWTTVSSKSKFNKTIISCVDSTKLVPQPVCCKLAMWPAWELAVRTHKSPCNIHNSNNNGGLAFYNAGQYFESECVGNNSIIKNMHKTTHAMSQGTWLNLPGSLPVFLHEEEPGYEAISHLV